MNNEIIIKKKKEVEIKHLEKQKKTKNCSIYKFS